MKDNITRTSTSDALGAGAASTSTTSGAVGNGAADSSATPGAVGTDADSDAATSDVEYFVSFHSSTEGEESIYPTTETVTESLTTVLRKLRKRQFCTSGGVKTLNIDGNYLRAMTQDEVLYQWFEGTIIRGAMFAKDTHFRLLFSGLKYGSFKKRRFVKPVSYKLISEQDPYSILKNNGNLEMFVLQGQVQPFQDICHEEYNMSQMGISLYVFEVGSVTSALTSSSTANATTTTNTAPSATTAAAVATSVSSSPTAAAGFLLHLFRQDSVTSALTSSSTANATTTTNTAPTTTITTPTSTATTTAPTTNTTASSTNTTDTTDTATAAAAPSASSAAVSTSVSSPTSAATNTTAAATNTTATTTTTTLSSLSHARKKRKSADNSSSVTSPVITTSSAPLPKMQVDFSYLTLSHPDLIGAFHVDNAKPKNYEEARAFFPENSGYKATERNVMCNLYTLKKFEKYMNEGMEYVYKKAKQSVAVQVVQADLTLIFQRIMDHFGEYYFKIALSALDKEMSPQVKSLFVSNTFEDNVRAASTSVSSNTPTAATTTTTTTTARISLPPISLPTITKSNVVGNTPSTPPKGKKNGADKNKIKDAAFNPSDNTPSVIFTSDSSNTAPATTAAAPSATTRNKGNGAAVSTSVSSPAITTTTAAAAAPSATTRSKGNGAAVSTSVSSPAAAAAATAPTTTTTTTTTTAPFSLPPQKSNVAGKKGKNPKLTKFAIEDEAFNASDDTPSVIFPSDSSRIDNTLYAPSTSIFPPAEKTNFVSFISASSSTSARSQVKITISSAVLGAIGAIVYKTTDGKVILCTHAYRFLLAGHTECYDELLNYL